MVLEDIPEPVLRFIAKNIDSVPHLEALILLWENPKQVWTQDTIAERIYVSSNDAGAILKDLQQRKLIALQQDDVPQFQLDPAWDSSSTMVELVHTYRRHLVRIATFIHSNSPSAVREFARAFDFKKDR